MTGREAAPAWPPRWLLALAAGREGMRHMRPDDWRRLAALRHVGGPPFGGGPGVGHPFGGGRGRKRRGDVRVALLLLLAEEPRNGYQLMQTIEERSGGRWRPSPGSVYPALAQLEDEGFIRATEPAPPAKPVVGTKLLEITDAGRAHIEERHDAAPPWEADDDPAFETLANLRSLVQQVHIAAVQVVHAGDERQIARASETLAETRRALYRILAEDGDD
jgi:DNA-binding PadR family transcriptional regulator